MNFEEIARQRFSCRNFKQDKISEELLTKMLEIFRIAPSAVNFQPWQLIIIKSEAQKAKVYETYPREWLKSAPLVIIACGDHSISWKRSDGKDHLDIDISIAIDHLMLQATELGLATCWVCNFNQTLLKANFKLPENIEPIAIIPIGYPVEIGDSNRHNSKRKALKDFVHWESYS